VIPYAHQVEKAALFRERRKLLANHDCGVGKTITTLMACAADPMPTLVLAPRAVMESAWLNDAKHFPGVKVGLYHGPKRKLAGYDVTVTTHETFRRDAAKLKAAGFQRFVIDESSKIKHHDSGISKAAMAFSRGMKQVILLSGTPAPNTPAEYWPQMYCIDPDILGWSYWGMISRYFVPVRRKVWAKGKERDVIERLDQTDEQRARFAARIAPYVDVLKKEQCLTLPPVTDVVRAVELGAEEWKAYKSAEECLRVELESGEVEKLKMESLLGKLRQISGGAVYGAEKQTHHIGTSKLDAMDEVLEEIGPAEPVVLWAEYRSEIDRIAERTRAEIIDGRTKDAAAIVARFQRGEIPRLVCHPQAAGHGVTLVRACYAIFYSLSFSAELFDQARARLDRAGQTRPVTNIMLLAKGTVDATIYGALRSKKSASAAVVEAIRGGGDIHNTPRHLTAEPGIV
jgi:SNF2 family DNA or RNA helicase